MRPDPIIKQMRRIHGVRCPGCGQRIKYSSHTVDLLLRQGYTLMIERHEGTSVKMQCRCGVRVYRLA